MRVLRRAASALALYGVPVLVVVSFAGWWCLRLTIGVSAPVVTTTSTAMKPAVRPGDLVLLRKVHGNARVGEVVAFDAKGGTAIRRVTAVAGSGSAASYTVKGDNRPGNDPGTVRATKVVGAFRARAPGLGYLLYVEETIAGKVLIAAFFYFAFAGALRRRWHRQHEDAEADADIDPDDVAAPIRVAPEQVAYGGEAMSITPAELRHVRFAQVRRGYDTEAVDRALESVADSIEELLHERHEILERVRQLEGEIERYREVEATLSQTLMLAERAAEELKAEAQLEADRILSEARAQMAAAQQAMAAARDTPAAAAAPPISAMPDPAFIELLGETRAIRSLLQALLTQGPGATTGTPFAPRQG